MGTSMESLIPFLQAFLLTVREQFRGTAATLISRYQIEVQKTRRGQPLHPPQEREAHDVFSRHKGAAPSSLAIRDLPEGTLTRRICAEGVERSVAELVAVVNPQLGARRGGPVGGGSVGAFEVFAALRCHLEQHCLPVKGIDAQTRKWAALITGATVTETPPAPAQPTRPASEPVPGPIPAPTAQPVEAKPRTKRRGQPGSVPHYRFVEALLAGFTNANDDTLGQYRSYILTFLAWYLRDLERATVVDVALLAEQGEALLPQLCKANVKDLVARHIAWLVAEEERSPSQLAMRRSAIQRFCRFAREQQSVPRPRTGQAVGQPVAIA